MNDLDNVGIRDVDVDLREKPIIREEDRDIETETSNHASIFILPFDQIKV